MPGNGRSRLLMQHVYWCIDVNKYNYFSSWYLESLASKPPMMTRAWILYLAIFKLISSKYFPGNTLHKQKRKENIFRKCRNYRAQIPNWIELDLILDPSGNPAQYQNCLSTKSDLFLYILITLSEQILKKEILFKCDPYLLVPNTEPPFPVQSPTVFQVMGSI